MQYPLKTQRPEKQQFDALMLVVEAPVATLAGAVVRRRTRHDVAAVVGQLRYLAAQIEAQGTAPE